MREPECTEFIASVPTTWDETVGLDGRVGEYVSIARRKGDTWYVGGMPDWTVWILCVVFTLIWARIAALFANKATPRTLNRVTGVILVVLGIAVMCFNLLA